MDSLVLAEVIGGLGVVTLNRPKALNALSLDMVRELDELLRRWSTDETVHGVLFRGAARSATVDRPAGPVHFCAGGDIRFMHEAAVTGDLSIDDFFTEEYALDHRIHAYAKPVIAWMEGITMGGGMGLAQGAKLRVVTEHVRMAMPETRIGLFPDVAGGYFLSRCAGAMGEYLGIVGPHWEAGDAIALGLADAHAQAASIESLLDAFKREASASPEALMARVRAHVAAHPLASLPEATVASHADQIDRHFSLPTLAEIEASLRLDTSAWAQETLGQMAGHSPLMMGVTLAQIRRARTMSLPDVFRMERGIVRQCFSLRKGRESETIEGVRALVIDKDKRPMWTPSRIDQVTPDMVAAFFASPWPASMHPLRDLA